jgi:N-acyl-L-homoserine lactone synthetase
MVWKARELRAGELREAGKLRFQFFVEKRGWVKDVAGEVEFDRYDPHAIHLGVFADDRLVGYMRALSAAARTGMMLDHDFRECLTDLEFAGLERSGAVELSRRALAEDLELGEARAALGLLFKLFYSVVRERGFQHVYLVQEPAMGQLLRRGFGLDFQPLSAAPYTFADGTRVNVDGAPVAALVRSLAATGRLETYEAFHEARSRIEVPLHRHSAHHSQWVCDPLRRTGQLGDSSNDVEVELAALESATRSIEVRTL